MAIDNLGAGLILTWILDAEVSDFVSIIWGRAQGDPLRKARERWLKWQSVWQTEWLCKFCTNVHLSVESRK
jgi:hypothetical protein